MDYVKHKEYQSSERGTVVGVVGEGTVVGEGAVVGVLGEGAVVREGANCSERGCYSGMYKVTLTSTRSTFR